MKSYVLITTIIGLSAILSGCDVLNVNNPNSLVEQDLENPAAAPAIANGAEATLTSALGSVLAPYSVASDELTWIGTRDAWLELNQGRTASPTNEFIDEAFTSLSQARWTADQAVLRLERFRENGTLTSADPLIRAYAYAAISYTTIAETFDDFVISDRTEAAPAVGAENIGELFDTAIGYVNKALDLDASSGNWRKNLLSLRARIHFSAELRRQNAGGFDIGSPLVHSELAAADARDALQLMGQEDWVWQLQVTPQTPGNSLAFNVNSRRELRISNSYVSPTSDNTRVDFVTLEDPITEAVSPTLTSVISSFTEAIQYADFTVVSKRELLLILAESGLANNDGSFETNINALRSLDNLPEYSGQTDAQALLVHSRQVNLFLQGRRLADQYRFGIESPEWTSTFKTTGKFFPITISEINSNPFLTF